MVKRRLDDWYRTINAIYLDRNFYRTLESIYLHFIEVATSLNTAGDPARKRHIVAEDFLPKSLAWFFATCGRAGIPSVERLIWTKFPGVCPYCHLEEHRAAACKERNPAKAVLDWESLRVIGNRSHRALPATMAGWQRMFDKIYPRDEHSTHDMNIKRLAEEIGETAETIRVLPVAPRYLISELPDLFAWLMGFANQFDLERGTSPDAVGSHLEALLYSHYPDKCVDCGFAVCKCSAILESTLGRIAKDGPDFEVFPDRGLFSVEESIAFFREAQTQIRVGDVSFEKTSQDFKLFRDYLSAILERIAAIEEVERGTAIELTKLISQTEVLARQGTLLQDDVDRIVEFAHKQPAPLRGAVINFLLGVAGNGAYGGMTAALVRLTQQ